MAVPAVPSKVRFLFFIILCLLLTILCFSISYIVLVCDVKFVPFIVWNLSGVGGEHWLLFVLNSCLYMCLVSFLCSCIFSS